MELWMGKAIEKIHTLKEGNVFVVKDLFEGVDWNNLSVGERTAFGKYFKNRVVEKTIPNVILNGRAQNNSTRYIVK